MATADHRTGGHPVYDTDPNTDTGLRTLQERLGYRFQDRTLLVRALTHASAAPTSATGLRLDYQRLEFLGDAVLGMAVADMLYALFPDEAEGALARRQAALVRGESFVRVALALELGQCLILSASESASGGRTNPALLEDACEALFGALYLDGGWPVVQRLVRTHLEPLARTTVAPPKDAKSALQEWLQARSRPVPVYSVLRTDGPDHAPRFTVRVSAGPDTAEGTAATKRAAEQAAAAALLHALNPQDHP